MSINRDNNSHSLNRQVMIMWESALYYSLFFIVKAISFLPFRMLYVLSDFFYYPLYYVVRYRRNIVRRNLTESFPEKKTEEIVETEKKFYHFFMDTVFESVKLLSASKEEIVRRMQFPNIEKVNQLLNEGKSVSAFLGHYGNWEWLSTTSLHTIKDAEIVLIYHKLRNKPMDRLIKTIRERTGSVCIDMYRTVRYMAEAKDKGNACMIGFLADQSPKKREVKYFLKFLNHNTPVLTGTEKATKHYGYEALFASVKRVKRGYYTCTFHTLHDNAESLPDFELTNIYYKRLEQEIKESPELYLWTHNRFKHALLE